MIHDTFYKSISGSPYQYIGISSASLIFTKSHQSELPFWRILQAFPAFFEHFQD